MRRLIPLLLFGLLVGAHQVAEAKDRPQKSAQKQRARKKAMRLFEESKTLYQQGQFQEAAARLERAYALDPAPTLLYNLARALESGGDEVGAAQAYRRYLVVAPKTPDRAAIKKRIENLETRVRERQALMRRLETKPSPPPPPVVPPPPDVSLQTDPVEASEAPVAPWIVAGLGGAGIATGVILGVMAAGKNDDAERASSQRDTATLNDDAQSLALGANIAFIAGGTLAAGGIVWGLIMILDGSPSKPNASWVPTVGSQTVGIAGQF